MAARRTLSPSGCTPAAVLYRRKLPRNSCNCAVPTQTPAQFLQLCCTDANSRAIPATVLYRRKLLQGWPDYARQRGISCQTARNILPESEEYLARKRGISCQKARTLANSHMNAEASGFKKTVLA
ncbi:hypothetical protein BsWGS_17533 [Bradybaena similaris]